MKEQDVWQLATELWEKREEAKLMQFDMYKLKSEWFIDIYCAGDDQYHFTTEAEVRRFLDGLE